MSNKKIVSDILNLKKIIYKHKLSKKKIVYCHGVFDLLHIGHIKYLEESKSYGDILVVTVTSSEFIKKTPNRPIFSNESRMYALAALKCTDYIFLNKNKTAINILQSIKPHFYCKGPDYKDVKN